MRIFLDVCGSLGDYPASQHPIDVTKHTAGAFCTHYTLRRKDEYGLPDYARTSDVHFGPPPFTSTLLRSFSLRCLGIGRSYTQYLSMKDGHFHAEEDLARYPMLQLAVEVNNGEHLIRRFIPGDRILRGFFDPYFQNVVAPAHLMKGIDKRILEVCFLQLRDTGKRNIFYIANGDLLKQLRNSYQSCIFHTAQETINAVGITNIYAVILVLPLLLKALEYEQHVEPFSFLETFSDLSDLLFWRPFQRMHEAIAV